MQRYRPASVYSAFFRVREERRASLLTITFPSRLCGEGRKTLSDSATLGPCSTGALQHWGPAALGPCSTGPCSIGALQHWGPAAPGPCSTGALQHWGPAALGTEELSLTVSLTVFSDKVSVCVCVLDVDNPTHTQTAGAVEEAET